MKINYTNNTIEMRKSEAKKASVIGSEEYKALLGAKSDFPSYSIKIVSRESKKADHIRGLTYEYMEAFIKREGTPEQLERFHELCNGAFQLGDTRIKYGSIRKWFLEEFPQIMAFKDKVNAILAHKEAV